MTYFGVNLQAAVQYYLKGSFEQAESICNQLLNINGNQAQVLNLLGTIKLQFRSTNAAAEYFLRAAQLEPTQAVYQLNLGECYRRLTENALALQHLRRATALAPQLAEAHYNLALAYVDADNISQAAAAFEQAIRLKPQLDAGGLYGDVLRQLGDFEKARAYLESVLRLTPNNAEVRTHLGSVLRDMGRTAEAQQQYEQALDLNANLGMAHAHLGWALTVANRIDEGIVHLQRGAELDQRLPSVYTSLSSALFRVGRVDEAVQAMRRGLELRPYSPALHSDLLFALAYQPEVDARTLYNEAIEWGRKFADPLASVRMTPKPSQQPDRRLKIGYVSSAFCNHVESHVTVPVFRHLDHSQFEVYCYSGVKAPTRETAVLRGCADVWREIWQVDDDEVARRIAQDGIDILLHLGMHQGDSRSMVFAYKPAPIQASWLAYPGTTGISTIDYRFTDRYLDPPGTDMSVYSETSLMLADSFWCYDPLVREPDVNALPALARGTVTFGCLNKPAKISAAALTTFARILKAMPDSRLCLVAPPGERRQYVASIMSSQGVNPERIEFVFGLSQKQYRETYHGIDIGLDPFPYNGGITTLDATWIGVPVVTLVGTTSVGRAGYSIAMNLGMPELVAHSTEQYVDIALRLAHDRKHLAELRANLRPMIERSPLMDGARFARSLEALYRHMWQVFVQSQS